MDSFWSNIFKGRGKGSEATSALIRDIPIFEGLGKRDLASISRMLHSREYRAGETIFAEGDPAAGMYIIVEGRVEIFSEHLGSVLAELGDGEFFGELALMDDSPRSAKAVARTPCRMLGFFQPDLSSLSERDPRLGMKIITRLARIVGERLKRSNDKVQELREALKKAQGEPPGDPS